MAWYSTFDERRMVFILDEVTLPDGTDAWDYEVPATFAVCANCGGKGHHVNRAIDGHGISPDEFAEDPDFAESYFAGVYDVPCDECAGRRVEPVIDEVRATPEQLKVALDSRISPRRLRQGQAERRAHGGGAVRG